MEQIIIDGVNLSEMKVRYDALAQEQAQMRSSIRQGASKFIAEAIKDAKVFLDQIVNADEDDEEKIDLEIVSSQALALLKNAKFVSDISGVGYDLPYYDRQGEYCPDGELYTSQLEESIFGHKDSKSFEELWGLLEDMESEVAEWNMSFC
jgi:hypothetical protein